MNEHGFAYTGNTPGPTRERWRPERDRVQARMIKDSISPDGIRLSTLEVTIHRFVLAELNTHRVFSRNSESSRAVPFHKRVAKVREAPAIPLSFPVERKGMQGGEEMQGEARALAVEDWLEARDAAVEMAESLAGEGVFEDGSPRPSLHKSVVNRLLEPFLWHTVVITATEWEGFFHQRRHEAAQPEIRVAAECMWLALDESTPTEVGVGQWHLPFIEDEDWTEINRLVDHTHRLRGRGLTPIEEGNATLVAKQVSAARSARTSYLTHDGRRAIEDDLVLYSRLVYREPDDPSPVHWSPLEHVATPYADTPAPEFKRGVYPGNLVGWFQHRHEWDVSPYA